MADTERRAQERSHLETVADEAARRTVERMMPQMEDVAERVVVKTLKGLGINADDPIAMQAQMVSLKSSMAYEAHPDTPKKRQWVEDTWRRCEKVKSTAMNAAVNAAVLAVLGLIVLGAVAWLSGERLS